MFFNFKYFIKFHSILLILILTNCQLNDSNNKHGIIFLENRAKKIKINHSNTNDVLKIIGQPHSKLHNDKNNWIYIERVFVKGKFHKLGQNVIKENNILVLYFDKYGILKNKKLLKKNDLNELSFSEDITRNDLAKKSFVEKFLNSIKSKMYGNR